MKRRIAENAFEASVAHTVGLRWYSIFKTELKITKKRGWSTSYKSICTGVAVCYSSNQRTVKEQKSSLPASQLVRFRCYLGSWLHSTWDWDSRMRGRLCLDSVFMDNIFQWMGRCPTFKAGLIFWRALFWSSRANSSVLHPNEACLIHTLNGNGFSKWRKEWGLEF